MSGTRSAMWLGQPGFRILRISLAVTLASALLALSILYSISMPATPSPQVDPPGQDAIPHLPQPPPPPLLLQPTPSLPNPNLPTLACTPDWRYPVEKSGISDELIDGVCEGNPRGAPPATQRWGPQGPGDARLRAEERSDALDSTACGESMGESSHPMSKDDFHSAQFLAIVRMPDEQLSKARMHFAEMVALAKVLNRVLVLPRVGLSTIGMNLPLPYCAYFDGKLLGSYVKWVTYEYYLKMTRKLGSPPSVQFLCLRDKVWNCNWAEMEKKVWFLAITHGLKPQRDNFVQSCLENDEKCLEDEGYVIREPMERGAISHLFGEATLLAVGKVSWFEVGSKVFLDLDVSNAMKHIMFAPQLEAKANSLIESLGANWAAVHMRFEKLCAIWLDYGQKDEALDVRAKKCGRSFIKLVKRIREEKNITSLYVSSDVSLVSLNPYMNFGEHCEQAIKPVAKAIAESVSLVSLETLAPDLTEVDHGVQGVVSKLICQKSETFLAGAFECGGTHSYEQEICEGRIARGITAPTVRWPYKKRVDHAKGDKVQG